MNYELMENNKVYLKGEVISGTTFSHETYGEKFYDLTIKVDRLSSNFDCVPVTVSSKLLSSGAFDVGRTVAISGQFRSYNKLEDGKSRLILTVFVRSVLEQDEESNPNIVTLTGFLCKEPIYRTTPFGREICDLLVAVNRAYNKSDYLPCIAWGRNARFVKDIPVGKRLSITGRIQSREYQKKLSETDIQTRTAYEISIAKIDIVEEEIDNLPTENIS